MTGGNAKFGSRDQAIRTLGGANDGSLDDLEALDIPLAGGRKVKLVRHRHGHRRLGRAEDPSPASTTSTVVAFGIFRAKGDSDVEVNERVAARDRRSAEEPIPMSPSARSTTRSSYTEGNYDSAMDTLLEGALLSGHRRAALPARHPRHAGRRRRALPLSIIPTFWALDMMGFSLNLVSLLGITLVVGILVDDAIVEIENIVRHIKMGKTPYRGVAGGGRRDRPGRHRHLGDDHGGVRAGLVHGRHRRPVFQAVRPDRRGRRVLLAAGRAPDHADDGGLLPARPRPCRNRSPFLPPPPPISPGVLSLPAWSCAATWRLLQAARCASAG